MVRVGTVQLVAFSFDLLGPRPASVVAHLRTLRMHGVIEVLDVLFVSTDEHGALRFETDTIGLKACSEPIGSTLRQLFDDDNLEGPSTVSLELQSSREIGLDLEAIENFSHCLEPDTTTLLLLLEASWAMTLRDAVLAAGGTPIAFACLEPETMLVIGPHLTRAAEARANAEAAAAATSAGVLEALAAEDATAMIAAVIRALVSAHVIDRGDIIEAVRALVGAELVSRSAIERSTARVARLQVESTPDSAG